MTPLRTLTLLALSLLAACTRLEADVVSWKPVRFEAHGMSFEHPEHLVVEVAGEPPRHIVTASSYSFRVVLQDFPASSVAVDELQRKDPGAIEESLQGKLLAPREGEVVRREVAGAPGQGRRYRIAADGGEPTLEIFYVRRGDVITKLILRTDGDAGRASADRAFGMIAASLR